MVDVVRSAISLAVFVKETAQRVAASREVESDAAALITVSTLYAEHLNEFEEFAKAVPPSSSGSGYNSDTLKRLLAGEEARLTKLRDRVSVLSETSALVHFIRNNAAEMRQIEADMYRHIDTLSFLMLTSTFRAEGAAVRSLAELLPAPEARVFWMQFVGSKVRELSLNLFVQHLVEYVAKQPWAAWTPVQSTTLRPLIETVFASHLSRLTNDAASASDSRSRTFTIYAFAQLLRLYGPMQHLLMRMCVLCDRQGSLPPWFTPSASRDQCCANLLQRSAQSSAASDATTAAHWLIRMSHSGSIEQFVLSYIPRDTPSPHTAASVKHLLVSQNGEGYSLSTKGAPAATAAAASQSYASGLGSSPSAPARHPHLLAMLLAHSGNRAEPYLAPPATEFDEAHIEWWTQTLSSAAVSSIADRYDDWPDAPVSEASIEIGLESSKPAAVAPISPASSSPASADPVPQSHASPAVSNNEPSINSNNNTKTSAAPQTQPAIELTNAQASGTASEHTAAAPSPAPASAPAPSEAAKTGSCCVIC